MRLPDRLPELEPHPPPQAFEKRRQLRPPFKPRPPQHFVAWVPLQRPTAREPLQLPRRVGSESRVVPESAIVTAEG